MKSSRLMVAALLAVALNVFAFGRIHDHSQQSSATIEKFKVLGSCDMCKVRIEKAAKMEGVTNAVWNKETNVLTLEFDPSVVKVVDILKKVADSGHDNERFKAADEVYNKLPGCCKYR